jgi:hypothetical protein
MKPSTSHKIKHRDKPKDVFYTPLKVAQTHIASIDAKAGERWYDPFAGKHVYYDNFPTTNKVYGEITEGTDFFDFNEPIDIICSNPPYSNMDAVIKKTLELKPRVFSYLLLEGKITPKRMEMINESGYGLTGMYMCKVYKWYGIAVAYTFTRGNENEAKVIYDRIVHRDDMPDPEKNKIERASLTLNELA